MRLNWYKRAIAYKTSQSWRNIPHASFTYKLNVKDALKNLKGVSINTMILYVIAKAINKAPQVNAHLKYNRLFSTGRIYNRKEINIAMPMLLPNKEMRTVALMNVGQKSIFELQQYINTLRQDITNRSLDITMLDVFRWARESKKCTITVSNVGSLCKDLDGTITMLEIIPPQVVAIGVGAIINGQLPICIAFDHRALNFSDVLPFIKAVEEELHSEFP